MSRKYFLFSGITLVLLIALFDLVYYTDAIAHLSESDNNVDLIVGIFIMLIAFGTCIPSLILTIKAFKRKENNVVASVLLIIASVVYFGFSVVNYTKIVSAVIRGGTGSKEELMFWTIYMIGQFLILLFPVVLAIFSLFNFKRSEQDYIPSQKVSSIFFYIVAALSFQAFLTYLTTGLRGAVVMGTYSDSDSDYVIFIYLIAALAMAGFGIPAFVLSFFERKKKNSQILLTITAFIVLLTHIFSVIQYVADYEKTVDLIPYAGTFMECAVLPIAVVFMFIKFKTKEPEQIKTELE